jgi:DNA-binding SARP family transcriptional activator/class 3 adenylate cyclase
MQISFGLLGPVEVHVDGEPMPLGGARQRALLARLLIEPNQTVPGERLVEDIWAGEPRVKPLQMAIARCRQSLGAGAWRLHTRPGGYELEVGEDELDSVSFERLIVEGSRAHSATDPSRAAECASSALSLWRGPPLRDLVGYDWAVREAARLEEMRLSCLELRVDARLALGETSALIPELQSLTAAHPDRERLRGQLMLAFYRAGRQSEALGVFMEARRFLVEEYGLEPNAELQALHEAILHHEPSLLLGTVDAAGRAAARVAAESRAPVAETPAAGRAAARGWSAIQAAFLVWKNASGGQVIAGLGELERATIGRRPDNTVVVEGDDQISRMHVELELIGGGWTAADDGLSRNGTYINGVRLTRRQRLRDGDVLRLGRTTIEYRCPADGSTVASEQIEEFLSGTGTDADDDRVLATVLFTDIVGSTSLASRLGDRRWRELLDAHDEMVRGQLDRFAGHEIKSTGDGFLAMFDVPARAIRGALGIRDASNPLGLTVRAGLHTGELERRGNDVGGIAVHIGSRVAAAAKADEVLVSSTVKDLVAGSELAFADRGEHAFKGVEGRWRLFAVVP